MSNNRIQLIENYVKQTMNTVTVDDLKLAHDFKHVDRVRGWALKIAKNEGYEALELVEATALLHDIGLAHVEQRHHHAQVGAEIAAGFLKEHGLFRDKEIAMIAEAIRGHSSMRGGGTLGEILRDADMLEMFGAIGIMRALTSKYAKPEYDPNNIRGETWEMNANDFTERFRNGTGVGSTIIDQMNFQLSCYENLNTASARQIARPLVEFMKVYLGQLESEIKATQGQIPLYE
ncbi:HD domain-containing protein [Chloroflexota bacterium]